MKTNAMRVLEARGVGYSVYEYSNGTDDIALSVGLDPLVLCKTLVCSNSVGSIFVFVLSSCYSLDLKRVKSWLGFNVELVNFQNLRKLTGYIRGGVSPVAMSHVYPTYFESSLAVFDKIVVNGGSRGFLIEVELDKLMDVTSGVFADLI